MDFRTMKAAQIDKHIGMIRNRGAKVEQAIQLVGLACLYQIEQYRNVTPLNNLYKALPKGMRTTAFALWAVKYGSVIINPDSKARTELPLMFDPKGTVNIEGAQAEAWHKAKTERSLDDIVDVEKAVDALIKRLAAAKNVTNPELVKKLVALRAEVTADAWDIPGMPEGQVMPPVLVAQNAPALPALPAQMH